MQKTRVEFLHDGDYFEFANFDKSQWRNLRVKRVILDCGVFIEGERLMDKETNTWSKLGESYVIAGSTEVIRVAFQPSINATETPSISSKESDPPKKKRGRPPKNKKV